ncbi:MAG: methylglyoxal synthase [Clostridiales bacterium]|nr:methylglyoxal synthase [Clostridiales bacterium]
MNIALIAHDSKKELMVQLCIAYEGILSKNSLFATSPTANIIMKNTGLTVHKFLPGYDGGGVQIASRVAYGEIDLVIFILDHDDNGAMDSDVSVLMRQCDIHNVPIATNIATAEVMIHGLEHGDFAWRDILRNS